MTIRESRQRLLEAEQAYKTAHPGKELTIAREELTRARADYLADCSAIIESLPDRLKPFAEEAALWHKTTGEGEFIYTVRVAEDLPDPQKDSPITVGDLRELAKLYDEVK